MAVEIAAGVARVARRLGVLCHQPAGVGIRGDRVEVRDLFREFTFGGLRSLEGRSGPLQPSARPQEPPGSSRDHCLRRGA